eukprot:CAMPEP_0170933474 /NCGR_PEP_ID=MMETSP0735-20130129/17639_1 /TAXON_ID=186038 /ORGANISM="Fragilariopsis kerguelensis, Strain L26-C5" /LENGTH=156 /DNA_ID=CAMNT_0011336229 /DNA_START=286 /DNA_END=753 /DNA_ORIENTATION=-
MEGERDGTQFTQTETQALMAGYEDADDSYGTVSFLQTASVWYDDEEESDAGSTAPPLMLPSDYVSGDDESTIDDGNGVGDVMIPNIFHSNQEPDDSTDSTASSFQDWQETDNEIDDVSDTKSERGVQHLQVGHLEVRLLLLRSTQACHHQMYHQVV